MQNTESNTLTDQIDELPELIPLSAVASQLLQLCQDPDVGLREISGLIEYDPALSMKLLRVANSALYGFPGEIRTVDHAAVVLGFREVRSLTMSTVAGQAFSSGSEAKAQRQQLWQHSLGCASVGRVLADEVGTVKPEEVFLAGVVHDLGKLVFLDLVAEDYQRMHSNTDSCDLIQKENEVFGICHQEIGNRCAEEWGLPGEINDAISFHHCPETPNIDEEFVAFVAAANALAKVWNLGSARPVTADPASLVDANLGLTANMVEALEQRARETYDVTVKACA